MCKVHLFILNKNRLELLSRPLKPNTRQIENYMSKIRMPGCFMAHCGSSTSMTYLLHTQWNVYVILKNCMYLWDLTGDWLWAKKQVQDNRKKTGRKTETWLEYCSLETDFRNWNKYTQKSNLWADVHPSEERGCCKLWSRMSFSVQLVFVNEALYFILQLLSEHYKLMIDSRLHSLLWSPVLSHCGLSFSNQMLTPRADSL